ncbi:glycosyltransferase [Marinobacter lacisalsi]|uniref:Glycosyltransferase n=1 Tax=Marinobacter lacisalsi TaxID=475979 RepID=A0ABV8QDS0_9GAMM
MEMLPSVSIVIPAFNEEQYIEQTLISLRQSDYPSNLIEIIVVDNASSDRTPQIAHRYADKVLTLTNGNVGAVRNRGVKESTSDIIIFVDADCLVDRDWVYRGIRRLSENKNCIFGGPYKTREHANWVERLWLLENPNHPRIQPDLLGGCIFVRSVDFKSVGGFNEEMTSGEDSDLSDKFRRQGKTVNISQDLSVVHLGNPQTIGDFLRRQVWHSENYLLFIKSSIRDYTFWIIVFFILSSFTSLFGILSSQIQFAVLGLTSMAALSMTLSLKRLFLTRFTPRSLKDSLGIAFLDFLYLVARSIGLLKPLIRNKGKSN